MQADQSQLKLLQRRRFLPFFLFSALAGQLVCVFPEGKLTTDGEIDSFRPGIETIVRRDPVPVVPMALQGLWGSFFSHKDGPALSRPPRRFWSRIGIVAGAPWPAEKVTAAGLEAEVRRLRGDAR